jgi:O-glycosyl hydrolase
MTPRRYTELLGGALLLALASAPRAAETRAAGAFDDAGRLLRLPLGQGWLEAHTNVCIPRKDWKELLYLGNAKDVAVSESDGRKTWKATLTASTGAAFAVSQTASESNGKTVLEVQATAQGDDEIEGVIVWLDLPAKAWAGGSFILGGTSTALPPALPDPYHLAEGPTDSVLFTDAAKQMGVKVELPANTRVLVQDGRRWQDNFSTLIHVHSGKLPKGQTAKLRISLSASGAVEAQPVRATVDATKALYRVQGLGGNYCFGVESPVSRYTLTHLPVGFARTEMRLLDLKPFGNEDPATAAWKQIAERDQPGHVVRHELEMMRDLAARKIPFVTSAWHMPPWTYDKAPQENNNHIAEDQWPAALAIIGQFLRFAKEKYHAEPLAFSFNEPDCGARIKFSPQEHRDALKRIGAHLESLGLKTKMLLGDVCQPRGSASYLKPALEDPEALKYCNIVSFHSWGGASPAQYGEWAALAERLKLPLLVGEAGVDAWAWNDAKYRQPNYAIREMVHYLEILRHARPQAILLWEYTNDYSTVEQDKDKKALRPTLRFALQRHWCQFIPPGSEGLATASDQPAVLAMAYRVPPTPTGAGLTVHLGNAQWGRPCVLTGIPAAVKELRVVRSTQGELFKQLPPVAVKDGQVNLDLPSESLTTLTTLDVPELESEVGK